MEKSSGGSERLPLFHIDVGPQYYEYSGMEGAQGGDGRGAGPEGQDLGYQFHWWRSDHSSSTDHSRILIGAEQNTTLELGAGGRQQEGMGGGSTGRGEGARHQPRWRATELFMSELRGVQ